MKSRRNLDDRQVEALLLGHGNDAEQALIGELAAFRSIRELPPPLPSPALESLLRDGFTSATGSVPAGPAGGKAKRAPLRVVVLLAAASGALITVATGANALPDGGQRTAAAVLNALTPFHFPTPASPTSKPKPGHPTPTATPAEAGRQSPEQPAAGATAPGPARTADGGAASSSGHDGSGNESGQDGRPATGAPLGAGGERTPEPSHQDGSDISPEPRDTGGPERSPAPTRDPVESPDPGDSQPTRGPTAKPTPSPEITPSEQENEPPDIQGSRQRGHKQR